MKKEIKFPKGAKSINFDLENGIATAIYEEENPKLEVGKWYEKKSEVTKGEKIYGLFFKYGCGNVGFGLSFLNGNFWSGICFDKNKSNDWKPAGMKEVEELLIKEAGKRYPEGIKFKSTLTGVLGVSNGKFKIVGGCVYSKEHIDKELFNSNTGKWAEIIEEPKTLKQFIKEKGIPEKEIISWLNKNYK